MKVHQLFLHPVKSASAISVDELPYDSVGPINDRQWMVIKPNGQFLTQRVAPKMCLIQPSIVNNQLRLSAPSMPDISVAEPEIEVDVRVWSDTVAAGDCGDDVSMWLSSYLAMPCRLVSVVSSTHRPVDEKFSEVEDTVRFADGFPTLVVSKESLDNFNSNLEANIDMRRFRPNIVVSGCDAFDEDNWKAVKIRDIEFQLVKPCSRCIMPSINPDTAAKEMTVNDALIATRRIGRNTYFGQNAIHRGEGTIAIGDEVVTLS